MCNVFARQDPETYRCETRSVRIQGQVTSIRLERRFWTVLEEIVSAEGLTTAQFLSKLYTEVCDIHGEAVNFTSLLRCCCLEYSSEGFNHIEYLSQKDALQDCECTRSRHAGLTAKNL